ncbi:MAG: c-type cytochrome biogenesis protein CcsB [Deltaproteobacteria bacterium]|nr:c-type cytochrome biogenesis protein CcsB [Deltaproteobacteria bacterium]
MIYSLLTLLIVVLYVLSSAAYLVFIIRQNKQAAKGAVYLIGTAFALQTLYLLLRAISQGQLPVLNMTEALGFYGWALVGVFLFLSIKFTIPVLGAFVSPLAVLSILLSSVIPADQPTVIPAFQNIWLSVHLTTIFVGYGFFSLGFVAGVMYLLQEHQIKAKALGSIFHRLPSLNALDTLNQYSLTMGFPLITMGIVFGAIYAQVILGAYWRWDPKEVWSLVIWLLYAAMLHQRLTVGWRGRRAALMSILGFSVLCFTFFGVSYLLPGYHSFEGLERLQAK